MRKFSKFLSYLGTTLLWFAACVGILAVLILGEKSTGQDRKAHPIRTYATVTECTSYTGMNSEGEQKTFYRYSGTYETESGEKKTFSFSGYTSPEQVGRQIPILCNENWEDPHTASSLEPLGLPVVVIMGGMSVLCGVMGILWLIKGIRYLKGT